MKIGDTIAVIDEDLQGVILQIEQDEVTFLSDFDMEFTYPKSKLVVQSTHLQNDLIQRKFIPKKKDTETKKRVAKSITVPVFDLHIEKIQNKHKHLSSGQKLEIQLQKVRHIIQQMKRKHYKEYILVHGHGKGVLRNKIIRILKQQKLAFSDADYTKYGGGALLVANVKLA